MTFRVPVISRACLERSRKKVEKSPEWQELFCYTDSSTSVGMTARRLQSTQAMALFDSFCYSVTQLFSYSFILLFSYSVIQNSKSPSPDSPSPP
jgi:hypothetical protein